jgi:hypothetical protein
MEVAKEKLQILFQHVKQMVGYQKRKLHFYLVVLPELVKVWILLFESLANRFLEIKMKYQNADQPSLAHERQQK